MFNEEFICVAFDEKCLKALTKLHSLRCGEVVNKGNEIDEITNLTGYFDNILDLIYDGRIKPYILETVIKDINDFNTTLFIKQYGLFPDRKNPVEKEIYSQKRLKLATDYCHPFKYKGERYSSAFDYDYDKLMPSDKALKTADATLSNCLFVVVDEDEYISKKGESIKNQRTLGIMEKNYKNKIFKLDENKKKVTLKPMSIWKFGPLMKQGIGKFKTEIPNSITKRYDHM